MSEVSSLRSKYVAIQCYIEGGSRAAGILGCGSRVLFIAASDGREVAAYDTMGRRYRLIRSELRLDRVLDEAGKRCRHEFDKTNGHLMALGRVYVDADGDEVEEWIDCFPWRDYAPEAVDDVSRALGRVKSDSGDDRVGLLTPETLF